MPEEIYVPIHNHSSIAVINPKTNRLITIIPATTPTSIGVGKVPCYYARPCCGPEIGPTLRGALKATLREFRSWSNYDKAVACESLTNPNIFRTSNFLNAWDVFELHNVRTTLLNRFGDIGCGQHSPCQLTVMVDGKCHKAKHVNYVLLGWMWRIAQMGYPLDQLPSNLPDEDPDSLAGYTDEEKRWRRRESDYSLSRLYDIIYNWKKYRYGNPSDAQRAFDWAEAGYNYWVYNPRLTPATPPGLAPCSRCRVSRNHIPNYEFPRQVAGRRIILKNQFVITWGYKQFLVP